MRRLKSKNKKKYSSSVAVNNNNNIVQNKDHDSSGNKKTDKYDADDCGDAVPSKEASKCEIANCGDVVESKEAPNSVSSIPPICQEFLDVVSGMGLQIVPGQQLESQNSRKNEKPITQNQWNKSSGVLSSESTDTRPNHNDLKLVHPMPGIKKDFKQEEKRKDDGFPGKSMSSESTRAACYKKPPGVPQYSTRHHQLSGRSFLSSKLDAIKIKESKLAKEVKKCNEFKGDKTEQSNSKVEGKQGWNKNKKPVGKNNKQNKNESLVKLNKKNPILKESRLLDSNSELKMNSSNSVNAVVHDVSWDIGKYKSDHESALRWDFKKKFLENNKEKYPEEELVSLAEVFCNILFLGCTYSQETTQIVSKLGSDLVAEYKEMKDLNYSANLPSSPLKPERSTQPSFYCTDIRYRKSTDKVVSQSFINQGSKSSIKQVIHNKCIKQESSSSDRQKSQSSSNQVSRSSTRPGLITHKQINYEKTVKRMEELEPAIVAAAYDLLTSSKPTFSLISSEVHEGVLRAVGHVPHFTKVRLHDILMKHPSSFKIGSRQFKGNKNPTISLVRNEKKTSDDRDTNPSFYAGFSKPSFVNYDENSFEFEDDDYPEVLFSKEEPVLTLDSEIKAPKAAHGTIVTLTESDAEEASKENVDSLDWVDLVEKRDHDKLTVFSEKVLTVVNKLKSGEKNTKALARELKKLPINESEDELDQCAGLILGLAVDDQILTVSCADLCKSLEPVKAPKEGRVGQFVNFRRLLLLKLQSQFEKAYSRTSVATSSAKWDEKLEREKVNFLGIVKFVGELYRVSMLTKGIVDECLSKLIVDYNDVLLEGGCRLLAGVAVKYKTETHVEDESGKGCGIKNVDAYFKQLQDIYGSKKWESSLSNLLKQIIFNKDSIQ